MVFVPATRRTMTPEIRAGIFAGESGGDYDALFGFNNRPGKTFGDVRVSQMTLADLDRFDQETYGPWSETQLGYRATPTGAYQIVGNTRRAAAKALGLGPDTVYDQATQDLMGDWILQNQGTGAWEGYKGPRDPSEVNMTASSRGGGGLPGFFSEDEPDFPQIEQLRAAGYTDADIQAYMQGGGQQQPLTWVDRLQQGLMAGGEALGALGAGHAPTFEATDTWLRNQQLMGLRRIQQAQKAGEEDVPVDTSGAVAQLRGMNREDLAGPVERGDMDADEALKIALGDAPVPGQNLSTEQLGLATGHQREFIPIARQAQTVAQTAAEINYLLGEGAGRFGHKVALQRIAKALDPLSVVREGEVAFVANAAGGLEAVINDLMSKIDTQGGVLNEDQIKEVMGLAAQLQRNATLAATQERDARAAQLKAQGIDPATWLIDPSKYSFDMTPEEMADELGLE